MEQEPHGARLLAGAGHPDDTGEPDPALAAALTAYAADPAREPEVLAALAEARLLVPVVAALGESETGADGLVRDKSADMATVLMRGADGRTALLAFTGLDALHRWDPEARPVPVPPDRGPGGAPGRRRRAADRRRGPVRYASTFRDSGRSPRWRACYVRLLNVLAGSRSEQLARGSEIGAAAE